MIAPDDATSIAATTIGLPRARRPADIPPSIPDYRFIKVIGRGAFGTVWLAEEPLAGVFRAIKVLDGGGRPRKDQARLANRELEGLHTYQTRVQGHPHLIQISKTGLCTMSPSPSPVGQDENEAHGLQSVGVPAAFSSPQAPSLKPQASVYYVMEIADHAGGAQPFRPADYRPLTLAEVIRRKGRLPLGAGEVPPLTKGGQGGVATMLGRESHLGRDGGVGVIETALVLLDAIEHLHKAGIHHRDIKPSNILFVGGVLKLADIGLVGEAGDESIGTSGYLPPDGKPDDLYAFGKVLYEMSTGLPASAFPEWPGDLTGSPPLDKGRVRVGLLETQPLSAVDVRTLPRLRGLINRLCHPETKQRLFSSAESRREVVQLQQRPRMVRLRPRAAVITLCGAAIIALLFGGIATQTWLRFNDPTHDWRGRAPFDGSEFECSFRWQARPWSLIRHHRTGEIIMAKGTNENRVQFEDLQTRVDSESLVVAGIYQIQNVKNPVTGDVSRPRGEVNQIFLLFGDRLVLLYHGQPGAAPGVRSRFYWRIPLPANPPGDNKIVSLRLVVVSNLVPREAENAIRTIPHIVEQSALIAEIRTSLGKS